MDSGTKSCDLEFSTPLNVSESVKSNEVMKLKRYWVTAAF